MTTLLTTVAMSKGITGNTPDQIRKNYPQTIIEMTINAPIDRAFNYIVPVELSHIFKKHKNLPAIIKTDENEKWIRAGLTRTVYFEDGSTSKETLLTVVPYTSFSYRIEEFTSPLRFFAKRIEGNWVFTEPGNSQTKIEWTYIIVPKNKFARGLIHLILLKNIRGLLTNAVNILKADLEAKTK